MNPNIPEKCRGCGKPILLENLYCDDGCPCNTPRGVNFKGRPCNLCKIDDCIKPGHHLTFVLGLPAELARGLEKGATPLPTSP